MFTDFILNGEAHGGVAEHVLSSLGGGGRVAYDPGFDRPYFNRKGQRVVAINTGKMVLNNKSGEYEPQRAEVLIANLAAQGIFNPVFNATSLRKEEWLQLDQVVLREARLRLRAWADLSAANSFGGFNGMSKLVLEHETMTDPGEAIVDMDGLTEGRSDAPKFQLQGLPLPITHGDFFYSSRRLAVSRNTGTPLDTTMAEAVGRRVAEMIEQTLIGTVTGPTYGGTRTQTGGYGTGLNADRTSTVYGYTNYPDRLTYTSLTAPTAVGWTAATTLANVLAMRDLLRNNRFYGPYMLYHSTDWDQYLDNDYILAASAGVATQTLRERLKRIDDIQDVRRLDFLASATNPFTLLMVQMTPDVCRAVNGMDLTTVQWESVGGMRLNFKVMAIQVPQIRSTFAGRCGILHATTS
jgi:hypothetical protein